MGFRVGAVLAALAACTVAWGQVTKGKARPAPTKFLMAGITKAHCGGVDACLKDAGPADDKAWETLCCHASCLNEVGYFMMDDGRCPDGVWAGAAKKLRESSAAVIAAAGKKDLEAARTAFKTVKESCADCHKAHKKEN